MSAEGYTTGAVREGKLVAKNDGDAWVLALAQVDGASVVSNEKKYTRPTKVNRSIPNVCGFEGIPHLSVLDFIMVTAK